jgi:hypothetical protein
MDSVRLPDKCMLGLFPESHWLVCDCLESGCSRDVTSCCLFQPLHHESMAEKAIKNNAGHWHCSVCGDTNEENFGSSLSLCIVHQRDAAKKQYAKKKAIKEQPKTRPCRTCGIQFWIYPGERRFLDCLEHRGVKK